MKIYVGIIKKIIIKREKNNKTFLSDEEFIKNRDLVLDVINKSIPIDLFNIFYEDNKMILEINSNIVMDNINDLEQSISNHSLFKFIRSSEMSFINFKNDIIDNSYFDYIDKDGSSLYYPVSLETEVIELWSSDIKNEIDSKDNLLLLLKYYSKIYMNSNLLEKILVYGIS